MQNAVITDTIGRIQNERISLLGRLHQILFSSSRWYKNWPKMWNKTWNNSGSQWYNNWPRSWDRTWNQS